MESFMLERPMMNRFKTRRTGFTLMEVLLVIGILLVLGTVSVVAYSRIKESSSKDQAKILTQQVTHAVEMYQLQMNTWPSSDEGLGALITAPDGDEEIKARWEKGGGPYLQNGTIPKDPWGMELKYVKVESGETTGGAAFHVYSFGPNKQDDNGAEDDIPDWATATAK